jgi:hypothetical protein
MNQRTADSLQRTGDSLRSQSNVPARRRGMHIRVGAVVAVAVAAGIVAWVLTRGSSFDLSPVTPIAPKALSAAGLSPMADQLNQPVYWARSRAGYTYELSRSRNDDIFIRYLPAGTPVGTKGPFLIVATYRLRDAYAAIQRAAKGKNSVAVKLPNDALAVYSPKRPTAYYFAQKGSHYQVGVFAPTAGEARRLVLKGLVVPVR